MAKFESPYRGLPIYVQIIASVIFGFALITLVGVGGIIYFFAMRPLDNINPPPTSAEPPAVAPSAPTSPTLPTNIKHPLLVNRHSGKVMTVSSNKTLVQSAFTTDGSQHLLTIPAEEEWVFIESPAGKRIGLAEPSDANGTLVVLVEKSAESDPWQQWRLEPLEEGWVKIVNRATGKVIGVDGNSTADGARLLQWDNVPGAANQHWKVEKP